MNGLNAALAVGAGCVLCLGLVSGYIKNRLWLSEPLLAMLVGIVVGPLVLDFVDLDLSAEDQNSVLIEAARLTLALSVMGAALRLPYDYEQRHWRELLVTLGLGMPLMWLVSSLVVWTVFDLPVLITLLIGAILTPTDPVLADSIVTGEIAETSVPARMRYSISAESGANDGLAVLLVMLPVSLLVQAPDAAVGHWLRITLLQHLLGGLAVGMAIGWLAGRFLGWANRQPFAERTSILTTAIALALTVLAVDRLLSTAAILAVFVAGLVFNRVSAVREEAAHERVQSAICRFFDIPIFISFGTLIPWRGWLDLGWPGIVAVAALLLLRRLPVWFLLQPLLQSVRNPRETLFNGWFGPIGVAALFYAADVRHQVGEEIVWSIVSLVVFGSIVLHGISGTPCTRLFGRQAGRTARGGPDAADCG